MVEHIETDLSEDSPPPVTDLSPALDDVEDIEDIEHFEEVEVPAPPADAVSAEMPASIRILPSATAQTAAGEPVRAVDKPVIVPPAAVEPVAAVVSVPAPAVPEPAAEASLPEPSAPSIAPPAAGSPPGDAELREFFAVRAEEIFRTVAAEAVEKVMWEMTDRLAAEFSTKLRESVEAVAWEVIPSTAEALIREEIARIRGKVGKPSH